MNHEKAFTNFTAKAADLAGRPVVFVVMLQLVILWGLSGPYFHYSDTWQLVINTSTTIITNLLGFLLIANQNRDSIAIQAKLDELLDIDIGDHRRMIGIEHMTLNELEHIRDEIEHRVRGEPREWR